MTVYDLTRLLLQQGIIYYQSGQYMLYGDFARKGLAKTRTDYHEGRDGQTHTTVRLVWTESGRKMVHDIYNAVKKVAEEKGYQAIFDRASSENIIFASPRIDVSNEVLEKLGYSN